MKIDCLQISPEMSLGIQKNGSRTRLMVDNIKCGGCANTIAKALNEFSFEDVIVDTEDGLKAVGLKAKSYLSSAIGKIS